MVTGTEVISRGSQELFTREWQIYRKMIDNDYLFHRGAYDRLHRFLVDLKRPFQLLDIACGDASMTMQALRGTRIAAYCGIDISRQALEIAEQNLTSLGCPIRLEQRNFIEALMTWDERLDIVWIGLSLHHMRSLGKLQVMRQIRSLMNGQGCLAIYENSSPDGESREEWLERWDAQQSAWTAYTPAEWTYVTAHVHASDFPETESGWHRLGTEAGFASTEALFVSPTNLFRLYALRP